MKKNERIYKALQNMPDKYIESAYEEKAVRKSGISWKSVVSAAACFLLVAALPVYIMTGKPAPADSINPETAETAAVTTEEFIPEQEKCDNSQLINSIKNINCTEINSCIPDGKSVTEPDPDGYYRIHFLVNKKFESEINLEIEALSDYLYDNFHDEYGDELYEYNSSYPGPEALKKARGIKCTFAANNGYLSVELCYYNGRREHVRTLNYNLVTEKKINDFSEMFLDPDNYIQAVNDYYRNHGYDEDVLSGTPENFTCYAFFDDNEYHDGYYIMGFDGLPEASGFIPELVNYDMTGIVEEDYLSRSVIIPDNLYSDCTENGVTYRFINEGSQISHDTADAVNTVLRRLEDDAVKKFKDEFGDFPEITVEAVSTPYIDSKLLIWNINVTGYDNSAVKTVYFEDHTEEKQGAYHSMGYMYDAVTEETLNLAEMLSPEDWLTHIEVVDYSGEMPDNTSRSDRGYIDVSRTNLSDNIDVCFVYQNGVSASSSVSLSDFPPEYIAE